MRRLAILAVALVAFAGTLSATASQTTTAGIVYTPEPPPQCTAKAFKPFSEDVWSPKQWDRGKPPEETIQAQRRRLRCALPHDRRRMQKQWRTDKRAFYKHRRHKLKERRELRERLRYLPYDCGGGVRSAIDCGIMFCESGGSYTARNPTSTAGGRYQIIDSTWYAYGGRHYADSHPAAVAPPAEQDQIASAIWAGGNGRSQWVC